MDDMKEIENKIQMITQGENLPADVPVDSVRDSAQVSVALEETAANIVSKAQEKINSEKIVGKYAKSLARNAADRIENEIDRQNVENERKKADNQIDRKELANRLFKIKQESIRLKKEQRHLSKMQKAAQKAEKAHAYWGTHKDTLEQYKMHEGSSRVACEILLWLDGVKCFFNGLSKVSDSLIKALKWIFIIGGVTGALMIIPATRNWILSILGFVK